MPAIFGTLKEGGLDEPTVSLESKYYFLKEVSGTPIFRPDWYFDVKQEDDGIVDITTRLVDPVQWSCFSEMNLNYKKDIQLLPSNRLATKLNPAQFKKVTKKDSYLQFLKKGVRDILLHVFANGKIIYNLKSIAVRLAVICDFEAPPGLMDTYHSKIRGIKANLNIRQGKAQQFKPVLYIESVKKEDLKVWKHSLEKTFSDLQNDYPGIELEEEEMEGK